MVDTSKFWLNYRHVSNALAYYHIVKRLGVPDSNIILMLADEMACNPRNPWPATIWGEEHHNLNLYDSTVEVDYRGAEVSVENLLRLLIGEPRQHAASAPCIRLHPAMQGPHHSKQQARLVGLWSARALLATQANRNMPSSSSSSHQTCLLTLTFRHNHHLPATQAGTTQLRPATSAC